MGSGTQRPAHIAPSESGPEREQAVGRGPARRPWLEPLLPRPVRVPAAGLLAVCVTVTAVLGVHDAGGSQPGWLDSLLDPRIAAALSRFPALLLRLEDLGTLGPVTLMTLALILACAATRRWSGAVLAVVAEPAAISLTEYLLKPLIGRVCHGWLSFPSGHATSLFALAAICAVLLTGPGRRLPRVLRWFGVLVALLIAATVGAVMVAIGAHYVTDVVGGAAVGIGIVLTCALALDLTGKAPRR